MNVDELRNEVGFGLENLERICLSISSFAQEEIGERVKTSALTYECRGIETISVVPYPHLIQYVS